MLRTNSTPVDLNNSPNQLQNSRFFYFGIVEKLIGNKNQPKYAKSTRFCCNLGKKVKQTRWSIHVTSPNHRWKWILDFLFMIYTRSSRARHGGPVGRAQPTQRSILKRPSLLIASIFPAVSTCASAWFDHLQVDSPKVTPIKSPVLYDSQTLCECQGPSGCDKPPSSPPNSTTKSGLTCSDPTR